MKDERVVIERTNGVTIYGKVLNSAGKVGNYEVESDFKKASGNVYSLYADAELERDRLVGVKSK